MDERPIRLGPDPNRTYLQRMNDMYPSRYGSGTAPTSQHSRPAYDTTIYGSASSDASEGAGWGLIVLLGGVLGGIATVVLLRRWLSFDTSASIFACFGIFLGGAVVSGYIAYLFRYVIALLLLAGLVWLLFSLFFH